MKTVITITGASGTGKSTLERALIKAAPELFHRIVSTTTRSPRPGEVDGKDYHFVSKEAFGELASIDGFIESAEFGDNLYGVQKSELSEDKVSIAVVEPQGLMNIHKFCQENGYWHVVVLLRGELEELINRCLSRYPDGVPPCDMAYLSKRLSKLATEEIHWDTEVMENGINPTFYSTYVEENSEKLQQDIIGTVKDVLMVD